MNKLKDHDIRSVLLEELENKYAADPNTRIVNEMGILHGKSRVDIAVINGILQGFEIKSESDTLERLPRQMVEYNKIFDRMTIVVQRAHLDEVKRIVPKWWGIWLITRSNGKLNIRIVRKGNRNKSIELDSIMRLLWRDEAYSILKKKGLHNGLSSKPKSKIYKQILECFTIEELKPVVFEQIKHREDWLHH